MKGKKVSDLHDVLLYFLEHRRDLLAPRPVTTHVPRPPDWREIESGLKRERMKSYFGKTTRWLVTNLQYHLDLPPTGVVNEATANTINKELKELNLIRELTMVRIHGKIILEDGRPAGNIPLRFYRYIFGGKTTKIGQTKTDEKGAYRIALKKDNRALIIEVRTVHKNKEVSLSKPITLSEEENIEINLAAPSNLLPLESEFSRLHHALKTLKINLRSLKNAKEDEERQDLSFLSRSTGWDARLIALVADAQRLIEELKLPEKDVEKVYALLRSGLPRDKELLVQIDLKTVEETLKKSKDENIVRLSYKEIIEFKRRFWKAITKERLEVHIYGSTATYGKFLSDVVKDRKKQIKFLNILFRYRWDKKIFWEKVEKAGFSKKQIHKLKLQGKLAFLTANSRPLVSHLIKKVRDPEELVERDLYKPEKWEETIRKLAQNNEKEIEKIIPLIYEGKPKEKLKAYARDMALKIRRSYPTQVVARMIEVKPEHFGVKNDSLPETLRQMAKKGFRIGQNPVEKFLKEQGIEIDNEIKNHLKDLHRVYQITPTDEAIPVLFNLKLTSSRAVTAIPEEEFVKRFEAEYKRIYNDEPPKDVARLIYRKAEQIEGAILNLSTTARWFGITPSMSVVPYFGEVRKKVIKELPTLEKLFGSLDFCECDHCHSVLSPAAYLVDLLHSLERWEETVKNGKKPYDVLTERRPDIPHIPLTCENTYTTMPYIDIVNEILEYWVVHNRLDKGAAHDTGNVTSEELIAEPQYIEPKAYEILQEVRYPLNLPFDLWIETAREFYNYFEVPLWRLLEVFRPTDKLFDSGKPCDYSKIFTEQLGLSPSEFELFTDGNILNTWYELYGYDEENKALSELFSAKNLANKLRVTYKELVNILETWFINPKLYEAAILYKLNIKPVELSSLEEIELKDIVENYAKEKGLTDEEKEKLFDNLKNIPLNKILVLADEEATCDFGKTKVMYADGSHIKPIDFLKINLFVRLWRKLGWSIEELDQALKTFIPKNVPFNEAHVSQQPLKTALIYLAHLKALEEKLNLGKDERIKLLTLWSDIPTTGEHSLYAELFLKPDILNTAPVFDDSLGHYLQDAEKLEKYLPALQSALGLTAEEIVLILEDNGQSIDNAFLTLSTVSLLYRYGLLAKVLKISVGELISLKKLSGIDPFMPISENALNSLKEDAPYQTIRFIEMVERVKEGGFKVEDLNYLFLHQFDPTGKYRPDKAGIRLFLKTIADGIRSIKAEHAVPDDPYTLSEDVLRQKFGLIFPPEVVDRFLAMLAGRAEFAAVKEADESNKLDPETFKDESSIIDVSYNSVTREQRLTYKGVLFEDKKNELIAKFENELTDKQKDLFSQLLNNIQNQAREFFDNNLLKENNTGGFFASEDFQVLFSMETSEKEKFLKVAKAVFPAIQARLIKDLVVKSLAEKTGADPSLVEMLVTDENMLSLSDSKSLLDNFVSSAEKGVTAIVDSTMKLVDDADTALIDTQAGSARFEGYIVVPTPGSYRFYIEADEGVKYELRFDHLSKPLLSNNDSEAETSVYTEFKANIPYRFTLELKDLRGKNARLLVRGENLPKGSISRLNLYPAKEMDEAEKAYVLLSKVLQLFATFELKEKEVRYILTHIGNLRMPVSAEEVSVDKAQKLFSKFLSLCLYSSLKKDLAGNTEDLVDVLDAEEDEAYYERLAKLTRRDPDTVKQTAGILFGSSPNYEPLHKLKRLWDALQIVHRFGVPPEEIADWRGIVNNDQYRPKITQGIRNSIKARFDRATWLKIVQPISDRLRKKKRDALSAYVIHKLGYERIEQLYEHFLIDPGMEPVVWTSRIRLAIASVQLFIQRCLLNLEENVFPSAINTKEWEWMKRYRVWEANRKIFLWPENWLEPEFRDDKTHIFQELEGTLLQGDVSEELVEDAFLNYLKKLDELARLDIVASHIEYKDDPEGNVLHVFGRTYNQPHKYFYRRYQRGEWTPWEPVNVEVQGDHLAPVVWHDRLWLFWVTFMEKPVSPEKSDENKSETIKNLADKPISGMSGKKELHAQLHWSIYDRGKWSAPQVSNFVPLYSYDEIKEYLEKQFYNFVDYSFWVKPQEIFISIAKDTDKDGSGIYIVLNIPIHLSIIIAETDNVEQTTTYKNNLISEEKTCAFYMAGRNAKPELLPGERDSGIFHYTPSLKRGTQYETDSSENLAAILSILIPSLSGIISYEISEEILSQVKKYNLVLPNNALHAPESPFFYQDDEHTFFAEPGYEEVSIPVWKSWVIDKPSIIAERFRDLGKEVVINSFIPVLEFVPPIDPRSRYTIKDYEDWLVNPTTVLDFRKTPIGEMGKVSAEPGRTGIQERGINLIGHKGLIGSGFSYLRRDIR